MSEQKKSYYVGGAVIKDSKYGQIVNIELDFTELFKLLKKGGECNEFLRSWKDRSGVEHKTIKLAAMEMRPENQKEFKTHSLKIDTWKPDPSKRKVEVAQGVPVNDATQAGNNSGQTADDDLPF